MSRVYQRLKGFFSPRQSSYDPYPDSYNEQEVDPPRNSVDRPDEKENDADDEIESVKDDKPSQPTTLRRQTRGRTPVDERPPSTPLNPPNSELRTVSNNVQPNLPASTNNNINTNINPTINTDSTSISNPSARADPPTQDLTSQPPVNPTPQTSPVSRNQVPPLSLRDRFLSSIKGNRPPLRISPNSTLVGFPPSPNRQPSWLGRSSFLPQQNRPPFPTRLLPSRPQTNISNIQIDYPIENVLIDETVPPSIAIKINEAVEHDRFGNSYYTQHYAYEPKTQHIIIGNNQQIERRLIGNSHHTGRRYIREIQNEKFSPQKQTFNNIELIIDNTPQENYLSQYYFNSFPVPIHHFIAFASPNDPMRCY